MPLPWEMKYQKVEDAGAKPWEMNYGKVIVQPQPPPKWATQQGIFGRYGPTIYGAVGAGWEAAKPAIEMSAAATGAAPGLAALPVNPLVGGAAAFVGGGAGYATAKQGTRQIDKYLGAPSDTSPAPLTRIAGGERLPQTAQDILSGAEYTAEGEVIPRAANTGLDWVGNQARKMPSRIINSLVKPLQKDFSYGKNPGRVIADEGIVANNFDDLVSKISAKRSEIGIRLNSVGDILDREAAEKGVMIDITDSLRPIDDAVAKAKELPRTNATLINRLKDLKKDLLRVEESTSPKGIEISTRKLEGLSFREALDIKRDIGDITKWTGNASDDKVVNMTLKKVWGDIKGRLNEKAVEINPDLASSFRKLNEKYSDITSAEIAAKYRDKIIERHNIVSLPGHVMAVGAAIATFVETGGGALPAILAGASGAALDKALGSTAVKTRLAAGLAKSAPAVTDILIKRAPSELSKMLVRIGISKLKAIQGSNISEADKQRFIDDLMKEK